VTRDKGEGAAMTRVLVQRALLGGFTLVVSMILVFVILRMIPSDPAAVLLREDATEEQIEYVRRLWGLDKPVYEQFLIYVGNLLRGDAGESYQFQRTAGEPGTPAFELVASRVPATIQLAFAALVLSILISIPLGVLTAIKPDSPIDHAVLTGTIMLSSLPNFWIGMQLILLFGLGLGLLPTGGFGTPQHVILPAITLALPFSVVLTRLTRTETGRVLRSDYIRTATAKGLSPRTVLWGHALRNALIPLVIIIGLRLGGLLNGAVVVETLFRWPGVGRLMIDAIAARDYPIVQVIVPFTALVFVVINFAVDVINGWVDPRVRMGAT
jgi:peptide/nickel transport system permease protein